MIKMFNFTICDAWIILFGEGEGDNSDEIERDFCLADNSDRLSLAGFPFPLRGGKDFPRLELGPFPIGCNGALKISFKN